MDLLTRNGTVSSRDVALPVVSAAISHLWQTLSEERKASLLQALEQKRSGLAGLEGPPREPAYAEDSMKDSGVDSQGASCSLESTPEEVSGPWGWSGGGHSRPSLRSCLGPGPRAQCLIFLTPSPQHRIACLILRFVSWPFPGGYRREASAWSERLSG